MPPPRHRSLAAGSRSLPCRSRNRNPFPRPPPASPYCVGRSHTAVGRSPPALRPARAGRLPDGVPPTTPPARPASGGIGGFSAK